MPRVALPNLPVSFAHTKLKDGTYVEERREKVDTKRCDERSHKYTIRPRQHLADFLRRRRTSRKLDILYDIVLVAAKELTLGGLAMNAKTVSQIEQIMR